MVLDAVNVGMLSMNRAGEDAVQKGVMEFVSRYGLLGFMTALPTTPQFMDYEAAYLPTNHFIKEESMSTDDYTALFFPFQKLDISKKGKESRWGVKMCIRDSSIYVHWPHFFRQFRAVKI